MFCPHLVAPRRERVRRTPARVQVPAAAADKATYHPTSGAMPAPMRAPQRAGLPSAAMTPRIRAVLSEERHSRNHLCAVQGIEPAYFICVSPQIGMIHWSHKYRLRQAAHDWHRSHRGGVLQVF